MYENIEMNERQTVPNCNTKIIQNKFTKSLTLFHTKKNLSKIITQHNTIKSPYSFKQEKYSKTNRIFFSYKKKKELGYILTNPTSPKINKYYNPLKTYNSPNSDQRLYKFKNKYLLNYGIQPKIKRKIIKKLIVIKTSQIIIVMQISKKQMGHQIILLTII